MNANRVSETALKGALSAAAMLCLSGCVAAALPVLAGGALARTAMDGIDADTGTKGPRTAPPVSAPSDAAPSPEKAAAARAQLLRLSQGPETQSAHRAALDSTPSFAQSDRIQAHAGDEPADQFADFVRYAQSRSLSALPQRPGSPEPMVSAALADPSALDGRRRTCEATQRTVLIDVDTATQRFSPGAHLIEAPALARGLAGLRDEGFAIAWISEAPAAYAGDLRATLKASGLDPAGKDQILLMRYPDERKQTRRKELAASSCLIAIAGDERADFDELFDYLARPEAALGLELLIGDGWFLVPSLVQHSTPQPDILAKDTITP